MKIFVLWAVIIAVAFIVPENVVIPFMVGSWFGIAWMRWFYA